MEVRGYADAADWVYSQALDLGAWSSGELLSLTELRHIHRLALTPVWGVAPHPSAGHGESPGSFREHDIQPFPGGMRPPPWPEVSTMVTDWIRAVQALGRAGEGIEPEELAKAHVRFEQIHPFLDGNGRTGRLVLNLVLIRLGYPPAIIFKGDRRRYLAALQSADRGDHGPLGELLARAILDNLHKFVGAALAHGLRNTWMGATSASLATEAHRRMSARRPASGCAGAPLAGKDPHQRIVRGSQTSSWAESQALSAGCSIGRTTVRMEPTGIEPVTSCLQKPGGCGSLRIGSRHLPQLTDSGARSADVRGCDWGGCGFQRASMPCAGQGSCSPPSSAGESAFSPRGRCSAVSSSWS